MLEDFVVPTTARRLRSCVLGAHLDSFCTRLADLGYRPATIRHKLWVVLELTRWLVELHLGVEDLSERRAEEFLAARQRRGRGCRGFRQTVLLLLEQLRSVDVVPTSEPARDDSPMAALLARYEEYLRKERMLSKSTIATYLPLVRAFVDERLGGAASSSTLCAGDVRDFLLDRARRVAPSARSSWPLLCARFCGSFSCAARQRRTSRTPSRRYASGDWRACHAISPRGTWSGCCEPANARRSPGAGTSPSSYCSPGWAFARARS